MTYEEMIQAWKDKSLVNYDGLTYEILSPKAIDSSGYRKEIFIVRQVTINGQFGPIEIDKRVWDGMSLKGDEKK